MSTSILPQSSVQIPRLKPLAANVGIFGVGFHAYWPQFDGLVDELMGKLSCLDAMVGFHGVNVCNFGMADSAKSA